MILVLPAAAALIASGCASGGVVGGGEAASAAALALPGTAETADPVSDERLKKIAEVEAVLPAAAASFGSLAWVGESATLHYRLFSPAAAAGMSYPLVVFFEGSGGGANAGGAGPGSWAAAFCAPAAQAVNPCFVVVPQVPPEGSNRYELVNALVADLCECLPVDPRRVYATGYSTGGVQACRTIAAAPDIYAAGVPVAGADPGTAEAVGKVPFWVFRGDDDAAGIGGSAREFAGRLAELRAGPFYTDYSGTGCDSRGMAYTNPRLFEWLFGQFRPE